MQKTKQKYIDARKKFEKQILDTKSGKIIEVKPNPSLS